MGATLVGCNGELAQRTMLLLEEDANTQKRLWLSEGFRTRAEQTKLYAAALIKHPTNPTAWAAKPGTSRHETGLAVDIGAIAPGADDAYRNKLAKKWGLKQTMSWEAWHFELDPKRKSVKPEQIVLPSIQKASKTVGKQAVAILPLPCGYYVVASDGGVFSFGFEEDGKTPLNFFGSMGGKALVAPIVNAVLTPSKKGYYLLGADGGIFTFGDAVFYGTPGTMIGYVAP